MKCQFYNKPKCDLKAYTVVKDEGDGITKWFYGTWDDINKANEVALEIGGEVWPTSEIGEWDND